MGKYHIDKVKKLKFARFGGLSSVIQRGYDPSMPTFHSPPASRGFYCFLWPYYELFLLGMDCTKNPSFSGAKFTYIRDKEGNVVNDLHPEADRYSRNGTCWFADTKEWSDFCKEHEETDYSEMHDLWEKKKIPRTVYVEKPSPRIFEYDGELWHHLLDVSYIKRKGDWVKTTMADYRASLEKHMHSCRREQCTNWGDPNHKLPYSNKNAFFHSTKDHLECFIEKL